MNAPKTLAEMKAEAAAKNANNRLEASKEVGKNLLAKNEEVNPFKKDPTIRYFCKIAGGRFIFGDGMEFHFHLGRLDVGPNNPDMQGEYQHTNPDGKHKHNGKQKWQAYQEELNEILGKQTNIFLPDVLPTVAPEVAQNALSEQQIAEADRALAGSNVKVNQEIGVNTQGTGSPTDVNQSTVDPAIRAAMMGNVVTTNGAVEMAAQLNAGAASSAG